MPCREDAQLLVYMMYAGALQFVPRQPFALQPEFQLASLLFTCGCIDVSVCATRVLYGMHMCTAQVSLGPIACLPLAGRVEEGAPPGGCLGFEAAVVPTIDSLRRIYEAAILRRRSKGCMTEVARDAEKHDDRLAFAEDIALASVSRQAWCTQWDPVSR